MIALLLAAAVAHGSYRWDIKTLHDSCAQVEYAITHPCTTGTVCLLGAFVRPGQFRPDLRTSQEWGYHCTSGILMVRRHEADGDLHLVITDGGCSMVCEIPDPRNMPTRWRAQVQIARNAASRIHAGARVRVTGVGFFDRLHDATGAAENGFEIHPVLSIARVP